MTRRQRELPDVLAQALVDGHDVNWGAAEELAEDESARRLVDRFRDLSEVLGHRARLDEAELGDRRRAEGSGSCQIPLWEKAILLLSLIQIAVAFVGLLGGRPDDVSIAPVMPALSTAAFTLGALWVMHASRPDPRAVHLGGFLLVNAVASSRRFLNWATPFLPAWAARLPFLNALQPEAFFAAFLWLFVAEFPRVVRLGRWETLVRWGTRVSVVTGLVLFGVNAVVFYFPKLSQGPVALAWLTRRHPSGVYWALLFALSLVAVSVAVLRLRDAPARERARVGLFVAGLVVGVGPLLVDVLFYYLQASWYQPLVSEMDPRGWRTPILYGFVLLVPIVASASVAMEDPVRAYRRFRVALGWRGLRMAFGLLTLIVGVSLVVFAYGHRGETFEELLSSPVLVERFVWTLALGAGYLLVPALRGLWLGIRVVPEGDLTRIPVESATEGSGGVESSIRAWAEPLFHPERLFLLVPAPGSRRGYAAAFGDAGPLSADSALASIAVGSTDPIRTSPGGAGSVFSWLPPEERGWVLDNRTSLLVPVLSSDGSGRLLGFLGLGPRRDGQEYGPDDDRLLQPIASACSLAVERRSAVASEESGLDTTDEAALECARCQRVVSPTLGSCPCGGELRRCSAPWSIGGKLRLTRRLGAGAMGVVYAAEDIELGRLVAVKALPRVSADGHLRLRQEARTMARMSHANVATIYGLESWRGVPLLLVEYLEGGTLESRLGSLREMGETVRVALQIADGLIALHAEGLVHRDIKPSNVGLTREGTPKLMDFGLARHSVVEPDATTPLVLAPGSSESEGASTNSLAGTPLYLPPELWEGRGTPGVGQDLWALSMVLYELLVGRHPFRDADITGSSRKGSTSVRLPLPLPLPPVRELNPNVPEDLADFLCKCLHLDPLRRPLTAVTWKEQLQRCIAPP